nr:MAG TPA: hypothetical protein [Caudoviricetes sp.]
MIMDEFVKVVQCFGILAYSCQNASQDSSV